MRSRPNCIVRRCTERSDTSVKQDADVAAVFINSRQVKLSIAVNIPQFHKNRQIANWVGHRCKEAAGAIPKRTTKVTRVAIRHGKIELAIAVNIPQVKNVWAVAGAIGSSNTGTG